MTGILKSKLAAAFQDTGVHLDAILENFIPGAKIGVVVWHDNKPNLDFCMVSPHADVKELVEAAKRASTRPDVSASV